MSESITVVEKPAKLEELEDRQHSVIAASAGTGKTFTLEHLVIDKIIDGVGIDEILVVTFTRRATAEMQQRIRDRLETIVRAADNGEADDDAASAWEIGDEEIGNIRSALNNFDDAAISTIHAFCQQVLDDFAFSSGEFFDAELIDADELYDDCFYEILRDTLTVEKPYKSWMRLGLIEHDLDLDKLKSRATNIVQRNARIVPCEPGDRPFADTEPGDLNKYQVEAILWHYVSDVLQTRVAERKGRDGLLTYNDLLEHIHDRVDGGEGGLADVLRERYRVVLVDEFQDTDPLQWEIVDQVFLDDAGDSEVYVIGDEKQSIYGFRGADVQTFRDAIEHDKFEGEPVKLETNFRSTPELIGAYNKLFESLITKENSGIDYSPVEPAPESHIAETVDYFERHWGADGAPIELLHFDHQNESTGKGDVWAAYVAKTADEIESLVNRRDGDSVNAGDIFVLTRTNQEAEEVGDALAARGLPYSFYRKPGLFETDEARDVLRLLRAIAQPSEGSTRRKAMMTPFFALRLDELDDYESSDRTTALTPEKRLENWQRLAVRREFSTLFDSIMHDSGVVRRELLTTESKRRLTNYRHLFDWLLEEAAAGNYGIVELADRLHRLREGTVSGNEEEETDLQRLDTDGSTVQIMTIHKAKGLSAKIVFVCGGFSRRDSRNHQRPQKIFKPIEPVDGTRQPIAYHRKAVPEKYSSRFEIYNESEIRRLFYVAITRAEAKVYLPYFNNKTDETWCNKSQCCLLFEALEDLVPSSDDDDSSFGLNTFTFSDVYTDPVPPNLIESTDDLDLQQIDDEELEQLTKAPAPSVLFQKKNESDDTAHLNEIRRRSSHSYSSLSEHQDPGEAVDLGDDEEKKPLPGGIDAGDALHEILEHLPYGSAAGTETPEQWYDQPGVRRVIDEKLNAYEFPPDTFAAYTCEICWQALRTELNADDENLGNLAALGDTPTAREVSFTLPMPHRDATTLGESPPMDLAGDRGYFEGEIDLMFEANGRIYLADWKSDTRIKGGTFERSNLEEHVRTNYSKQIAVYTTAALRMLGIERPEQYEEQFGGFFYLFVRGMEPESNQGRYFERLDWSRIEALTNRLRQAPPEDAIETWVTTTGSNR